MKKIAADVLDLLSASMKSFIEFFTCCGSRQQGSSRSAEDKRLMSEPEPRRSMTRKMDRVIDGDGYDDDDDHHEWKPSLVSIAEDDIFTEVSIGHHVGDPVAEQRRSLKRQVSSSSPRKGSGSSSNSHIGRAPVSTAVRPTLVSSRSFMF